MKREDIKTVEQILNKEIDWDIFSDRFSQTAYNIKKSMEEYASQFIDLAAEEAKTEEIKVDYDGVRAGGFYLKKIINKKSILNIKELIR